jgi:RNA polymerase sigma factor (sigma-70 family)
MTPLLSSALLRAQTDDRLVELAAAGHDRAFEAIVERYRRPLLRYLRRLLSDTLAEDVVQATFINAWSSLRTGTEVRELRPWLYRIAHNAAINSLKKVGEAMEEVPESAGGFATEPATELERRDEMQRALTSIAALPSRQRAALLAVAVDGRAHAEVAQELGLTDGAVRQLVHRARTTLRTGATAITPLPLLHAVVASAGDSTVARVAEVAAGAGGAGAASVSLKAGAAAILATGALVTGGPKVEQVVHPSQRPSQPVAQTRSSPKPAAAAATAAANAAPTVAVPKPTADHGAGASSSSGPTHHQRRRGHGNAAGGSSANKGRRERSSDDDRRGPRTTSGTTTSGHHRGSTSSGSRDASGSGSGRDGSGEPEAASGKHKATTTHETITTATKHGGGGGKQGGGEEDLVVTPPTTTAPTEPDQGGGGGSGGGHADAPVATATTPPPTVAAPPAPTTTTEPDSSGGGGGG